MIFSNPDFMVPWLIPEHDRLLLISMPSGINKDFFHQLFRSILNNTNVGGSDQLVNSD
ncbi:MAG: hypothetical protein MJA30_00620 [Cytophagales bacterium]|nr:hypothetical protein [Cytophagales bacterium]